jgi:hypothetical protein
MSEPRGWPEYISKLRTTARAFNRTKSRQEFWREAQNMLGSARRFVETTRQLDAAFDMVARKCADMVSAPEDNETKEATLRTIDELERCLKDAKPSEEAKALGLGASSD